MHIKLDLRNVAAEIQYDFWQGVTPSAYRISRVPNGNGLNALASFWKLDRLMASRFSAGAHQVTREEDAIRKMAATFVKVRLYLSGSAQFHDAKGVHSLLPGDIHIIDQSRPWAARYNRHDQRSIFIPHGLIGYVPSEFPVARTYWRHSIEGRLLTQAILGFFKALENGASHAEDIVSVVSYALHGCSRAVKCNDFKSSRDHAIRSYARLAYINEKLQAETLATDFGVSRATVYRIFREDGGLERFRMNVRLDQIHRLLAGRQVQRGDIARIASEFGYCSTAHFSDSFHNRFGFRPTAAARLSRTQSPSCARPVNDPRDLEATMRHTRDVYALMTG